MTTLNTDKVIAATDAHLGDRVYLTSCDAWSRDIAVAELLPTEDHDWRLAFANRLSEVVAPELLDAKSDALGLAELIAA